nr:hypothetical protein BaRGS_012636 [Batillaria attramentaria]
MNTATAHGQTPTQAPAPPKDAELAVAQLSDYQAVMDIDQNLFSGTDRLTYHYPSYLIGPGVKGYVLKKENKVVGFVSIWRVDGGETISATAARITPGVRYGGMFARFFQALARVYANLPEKAISFTIRESGVEAVGHKVLNKYKQIYGKLSRDDVITMLNRVKAQGQAPPHVPTPPDDEELAVAQLSDYQAVLDIDHDVFRGTDRLRYHYPSYIHGPGLKGFIYKKEEKVVAGGVVDMALGGDQGGSIRIPASLTGIVGLKPTFGLVPYTGAVVIETTLDHLGPMARTVTDCALLLEGHNLLMALTEAYDAALEEVDVLILPTVPFTAPELPPAAVSTQALTVNAAPSYLNDKNQLPVGMMIVGKKFDDVTVLQVARAQ